MNELRLEPYAVQQRWELPAPQPGEAWQQLLSAYVSALARACAGYDEGPAPVIGHIKLLALFPDRGYLRISAVSPNHPPTCSGSTPDGLAEVSLSLNLLVYGLPRAAAQSLARATASALVRSHAGQVSEEDDHGTEHGATGHNPGKHSHHDHT